ncbi:MAG: DUF6151 family protein [Polyangiales bacterium]
MTHDVPLRCRCGAVRGVIVAYDPAANNRVTCYCDDCQAFARWLGRTDVLDARGGSDIVQVAPARLRFTQGASELRCMRLSPKGPQRWYTACCKQPAGNALPTTRSPFSGLVTAIVDCSNGASLDALLGPSLGGVHGRFAIGGCPEGVAPKISASLVWRTVPPLLKNLVFGRSLPSPYVDGATGAFISEPEVISREARAALY